MEIDRKRIHEWSNPLEMAEKVKQMSGFDFLKGILNGELPPAPIAETLDFHPLSLEIGKAVFEFEPKEFHYNPIGSVHGGVISYGVRYGYGLFASISITTGRSIYHIGTESEFSQSSYYL